jgi:hypothetical protein
MLERGDSVPHFEVKMIGGELFSYASIWQRKNLLLITLPGPDSESAAGYLADLTARLQELGDDVAGVVTRDSVPHVPPFGVLVADRWGEVVFAVERSDVSDLPPPRELVEWLNFVRNQCPECEGEAK